MLGLKPPNHKIPKSLQLPTREVVTIIAGFRCPDGVVICGDTQEVVANVSKRRVTKVKVVPTSMEVRTAIHGSDLAASFCGAGEGRFIDLLTRKAWKSAEHAPSLDEACEIIEEEIKDIYQEYGTIFQPGKCPEVDLIYGVKMNGESRLFSAIGPVGNPVDEYCSGGIGYYMADFLASRMYRSYISLHQCVILAAYILFQAKENVDGCGGESHIAVLRHEGKSGLVDRSRIEALTKLLDGVDISLGEVLLAAADLRKTEDIAGQIQNAVNLIGLYRESAQEEITQHDQLDFLLQADAVKDDLGFITPSETQKSGDRQ